MPRDGLLEGERRASVQAPDQAVQTGSHRSHQLLAQHPTKAPETGSAFVPLGREILARPNSKQGKNLRREAVARAVSGGLVLAVLRGLASGTCVGGSVVADREVFRAELPRRARLLRRHVRNDAPFQFQFPQQRTVEAGSGDASEGSASSSVQARMSRRCSMRTTSRESSASESVLVRSVTAAGRVSRGHQRLRLRVKQIDRAPFDR